MTADACYRETQMMIFRMSHKMAHTYSIQFEDVLSKAHEIFVIAFETFDPNRGAKFSTWLQNKLFWGLTTWLKNEYRHRIYVEINEEIAGASDIDRLAMQDILATLSGEARMVVKIILNDMSSELPKIITLGKVEGRRDIQKTVAEYVVDKFGFMRHEVLASFEEITMALSDRSMEPKPKPDYAMQKCGLPRCKVWHLTRNMR